MRFGAYLLKFAYAAVAIVMICVLCKQRETIGEVIRTVDPLMVVIASIVLFFYRVVNASVWGASSAVLVPPYRK